MGCGTGDEARLGVDVFVFDAGTNVGGTGDDARFCCAVRLCCEVWLLLLLLLHITISVVVVWGVFFLRLLLLLFVSRALTFCFSDFIRLLNWSNDDCTILFLYLLKAIFPPIFSELYMNLLTLLVVSTVSLVCLASLTAYLAFDRIIPL